MTEADMELADENDDPLGMDGEEVECSPDIGMDVEDVECSPDNVEEETLKISESFSSVFHMIISTLQVTLKFIPIKNNYSEKE